MHAVFAGVLMFGVFEGLVRVLLHMPAAWEALGDVSLEEPQMLAWSYRPMPKVTAGSLVYDPSVGWGNRPGTYAEDGIGLTVRPDGTRGGSPRSANGHRVVFVGDSFTFGSDVEDGEAWPERLALRHPGWSVENRAVPGHGLSQSFLVVRNLALEPGDVVVVGVNVLTVRRASLNFTSYLKPSLDSACVGVPARIPSPEETLATLRWTSHARVVARAMTHRSDGADWTRAERAVGCLKALARARGLRLVLVEQSVARTSRLARCDDRECDADGWLRPQCDEGGLCVFGFEALEPLQETAQLNHWNPAAHEALATQVGDAMVVRWPELADER